MMKERDHFLDATPHWINTESMASRLGATFEQMGKDLGTGIEGEDFVTDTVRAIRNVSIAAWHGVSGVVPSIANAFSGQPYSVVQRQSAIDGTVNAGRKVFKTKGIVGKASAILAEATDGPVDDLLAVTGGAQYIIVPETRSSLKNVLAPQNVR